MPIRNGKEACGFKCDLSFMAEAAILLAYEEGEEPGLAFLFFIHT